MPSYFDRRSSQRIAASVLTTEKGGRTTKQSLGRANLVATSAAEVPLLVVANAAVEHNASGTFNLATGGLSVNDPVQENTNLTFDAWNPGQLIWENSHCLIMPARANGADGNKFVVLKAWSATKIRGFSPVGGITAGSSGTCTSIEGVDGHYNATTATCHLYTANIDVEASMRIYAQLYKPSGSASRWEIYAADCS